MFLFEKSLIRYIKTFFFFSLYQNRTRFVPHSTKKKSRPYSKYKKKTFDVEIKESSSKFSWKSIWLTWYGSYIYVCHFRDTSKILKRTREKLMENFKSIMLCCWLCDTFHWKVIYFPSPDELMDKSLNLISIGTFIRVPTFKIIQHGIYNMSYT